MKGVDLFCSSQASIATYSSLDSRSAKVRHDTKPSDDHARNPKFNYNAPCSSSQLPINPTKLYEYYERDYNKGGHHEEVLRRKSSVDSTSASVKLISDLLRRKSCVDVSDVYSPSGSNRYLLGRDKVPYIDWVDEPYSDHVITLAPSQRNLKPVVNKINTKSNHHELLGRRSSFSSSSMVPSTPKPVQTPLKSSSSARTRDQVVVLRVSIHCKGCEGKVRKHISKMEGVTSFSIDLETKKVTVKGDVTPLGVLSSISKVKNAQLWQSPTSSPSPSSRWSN